MCTSLVYRNLNEKSFGIGFNRDESIKRGPSNHPEIFQNGKIKFLCPIDGDYGGSWIGVNSNKTIYALLNYYEAQLKILRNPVSRGLLIKELIGEQFHLIDLKKERLEKFYPFRIIKVTLDHTDIFVWDGENIDFYTNNDDWKIYASSFLLGSEIEKMREEVFFNHFLKKAEPAEFINISKNFFSAHLPEKGPKSPCMHRREAHTVSNTIIYINNKIEMYYKNQQPCMEGEYSVHEI